MLTKALAYKSYSFHVHGTNPQPASRSARQVLPPRPRAVTLTSKLGGMLGSGVLRFCRGSVLQYRLRGLPWAPSVALPESRRLGFLLKRRASIAAGPAPHRQLGGGDYPLHRIERKHILCDQEPPSGRRTDVDFTAASGRIVAENKAV